MSFVKRRISIDLQLGSANYGDGKPNTVTVEGRRCAVAVTKAYAPAADVTVARIYGLSLDVMNALTTLGKPDHFTRNNVITIRVGDDVDGMALLFTGTMDHAWADFGAMPEVCFHVQAHTGLYDEMKPVAPTSVNGTVDVARILNGLATTMQMGFENNGVTTRLASGYYKGTARSQAKDIAEHAGIDLYFDSATTPIVMVISPKGQARTRKDIPLVSPATGLIGYPGYNSGWIQLRTLFNPSIQFGANINVQSQIKPACGEWTVNSLTYDLASETPGGPWFCDLGGYRLGQSPHLP